MKRTRDRIRIEVAHKIKEIRISNWDWSRQSLLLDLKTNVRFVTRNEEAGEVFLAIWEEKMKRGELWGVRSGFLLIQASKHSFQRKWWSQSAGWKWEEEESWRKPLLTFNVKTMQSASYLFLFSLINHFSSFSSLFEKDNLITYLPLLRVIIWVDPSPKSLHPGKGLPTKFPLLGFWLWYLILNSLLNY